MSTTLGIEAKHRDFPSPVVNQSHLYFQKIRNGVHLLFFKTRTPGPEQFCEGLSKKKLVNQCANKEIFILRTSLASSTNQRSATSIFYIIHKNIARYS